MNTYAAGYIFDLDGTLLDSLDVWKQIDIDFLAKRGIDVPNDYMNAVSALGFRQAAVYTIARFGLLESPEYLMAEWFDMAVHAYGHTVPLKPYAREYLLALKQNGAKLAIATSCTPALYRPALKHHDIEHLFDAILCTEDSFTKERPDIFLQAAARLGCKPSDCIVFEDLLVAINSAKSVGMTVYGVYDKHSEADWPQIQRAADGVLYDFSSSLLSLR